jgi:DUF2075 family protein
MVIDKNTRNIQDYKIHAANGEMIFGIHSFDTQTGEAEMAVVEDARTLAEVQPDGSLRHAVRGSGVTIKKIKLDGAYATYRGVRV